MTDMKIEIVPYPQMESWGNRFPGRKEIKVDGVRWGIIHMERHGVHGSSYWFEQVGIGGEICRKEKSIRKDQDFRETPVKVWSKDSRHRSWTNEPKPPSIEENLMATTKALIAEGLLRHPDVVKAEQEKLRKAFAEQSAKREREKQEAFADRAKVALEPFANYVDKETLDRATERVIEAMKWAQTQ